MKLIRTLAAWAAVFTIACAIAVSQVPQLTYTAQSGVALLTGASATATQTGTSRLPNFSGYGTLAITESGITGSPSGCTIVLKYVANNSSTAGATQQTVSFTPSTGVQYFAIAPTNPTGDQYQATYACSSTYPTAGLISVAFSPAAPQSGSGTTAVTSTQLPAALASGNLKVATQTPVTLAANTDPCADPNVAKSSVAISVTSATTTNLVSASGTTKVYVCAFEISSVGGTSKLEYGTTSSTACDTGATALTGPFAAASNVNLSGGGTLMSTPASQQLCIVSGASTTATAGVLTYVQQ